MNYKPWVSRFSGAILLAAALASSCELFPELAGDDSVVDQSLTEVQKNLGRGYNIFGNYADTKEVRAAVLDLDRLSANGLVESRTIETSNFQSFTGSTVSEYSSQMAVNVGVSAGFKAFSGSVNTNFSTDTYNRAEFSYATVQSQIYKSEISIGNLRIDELSDYLTNRASTDINDPDFDPSLLFGTYGTHVITRFYAGGRLDYNMAFDMSKVTSNRSLSVMASASFDAKFASPGISTEYVSSDERSSFESHTQRTLNVYGGSSEFGQNILNDNDYKAWIDSIQGNSQFVAFPKSEQEGGGGLVGIWEFAEDEERRSAIEEAFADAAGQQGTDIDNSLTVEVTLRRIFLVRTDDAGGSAELYGHAGFDGYNAEGNENLAFYGEFMWSVSESDADDWGEVAPGGSITVNRRVTRTFANFDESRSFIGLWGHLWEDDVSGDEDLGDRWAHVYMRHGWNPATEHKLYFSNAGTEAEAVFTIEVVN